MFCISPKAGKTSGEMQNLSAIYASFSANGGCQVCHPGCGRGYPPTYLGVMVNAVCGDGTINYGFQRFPYTKVLAIRTMSAKTPPAVTCAPAPGPFITIGRVE